MRRKISSSMAAPTVAAITVPTNATDFTITATGTVSAKVYPRSSRIEGPPPDLPAFVLDV